MELHIKELPIEIWSCISCVENIVDCATMLSIRLVSKLLYDSCSKDMYNNRKFIGFPRKEGYYYFEGEREAIPNHCSVIHIDDVFNLDQDTILLPKQFRVWHTGTKVEYLNKNYGSALSRNLVRGDILSVGINDHTKNYTKNYQLSVYDGHNLMEVVLPSQNGVYEACLPFKFTVLNDGIPLNYWDEVGSLKFHRICCLFDATHVKDEIIESVGYSGDCCSRGKSCFMYNKTRYLVIRQCFDICCKTSFIEAASKTIMLKYNCDNIFILPCCQDKKASKCISNSSLYGYSKDNEHPHFKNMIATGIRALNGPYNQNKTKGATLQYLKKYLNTNYNVDPNHYMINKTIGNLKDEKLIVPNRKYKLHYYLSKDLEEWLDGL